MPGNCPPGNLERARAYLQAIERRMSEEELAGLLAPEMGLEQFASAWFPSW